MPIDTGFIDAVSNIGNTWNNAGNSIANAFNPYEQQQEQQRRTLANSMRQNQINEAQDAAKKRSDIQQIIQANTRVNPVTGQQELDHSGFVAAVSAKYPEDGMRLQKESLGNEHLRAQTNGLNAEAETKGLKTFYAYSQIGASDPSSRQFILEKARVSGNPQLAKIIETKLENNEANNKWWQEQAARAEDTLEKRKLDIREKEANNAVDRTGVMREGNQIKRVRIGLDAKKSGNALFKLDNGQIVSMPDVYQVGDVANSPELQPGSGMTTPAATVSKSDQTVKNSLGQLPANQEQQPQQIQSNLQEINRQISGTKNKRALSELLKERDSLISQSGGQEAAQTKRNLSDSLNIPAPGSATKVKGFETTDQQKLDLQNKELLKSMEVSKKAIIEAKKILPSATGGWIGDTIDSGYRAFDKSTPGAKANARLKTLAGQIRTAIKLAPGSQSNQELLDRLEQIGDIGNPNKTTEERLAALNEYEQIQKELEAQIRGTSSTQPGIKQPEQSNQSRFSIKRIR